MMDVERLSAEAVSCCWHQSESRRPNILMCSLTTYPHSPGLTLNDCWIVPRKLCFDPLHVSVRGVARCGRDGENKIGNLSNLEL